MDCTPFLFATMKKHFSRKTGNVKATLYLATAIAVVALGGCASSDSLDDSSETRNADMMLVLDLSGSMNGRIAPLIQAVKSEFIGQLSTDITATRLGVVTFASGSQLDAPIDKSASGGFDSATVEAAVDGIAAGGWTATSDAVRKALDELNAIPDSHRSSKRAIVVFSDGAPNMIAIEKNGQRANLSRSFRYYDSDQRNNTSDHLGITTLPTVAVGDIPLKGRLPLSYEIQDCNLSRAARNLTENVAAIARQQGVAIYTIGFGAQLLHVEGGSGFCGMDADQTGANLLRRVANTNVENPNFVSTEPRGLFCHAEQPADLQQCFKTIANDIVGR